MTGYGDRAATILDGKKDDGSARAGAISAKSAISPPPEDEPGRAISAESAKSADPFTRWQEGHSRIVARELAGEPVPPAWERVLWELEQECKVIEDARRTAPAQQAELFDAPRRYV